MRPRAARFCWQCDANSVTAPPRRYRFEVQAILGTGSFGQVVRCMDYKSGEIVAVKVIRNKKRFHQQVSWRVLWHVRRQ